MSPHALIIHAGGFAATEKIEKYPCMTHPSPISQIQSASPPVTTGGGEMCWEGGGWRERKRARCSEALTSNVIGTLRPYRLSSRYTR